MNIVTRNGMEYQEQPECSHRHCIFALLSTVIEVSPLRVITTCADGHVEEFAEPFDALIIRRDPEWRA